MRAIRSEERRTKPGGHRARRSRRALRDRTPQSLRPRRYGEGMLYTIDNGSNWFLGDPPRVVNGAARTVEGRRTIRADVLYVVERASTRASEPHEVEYGGHVQRVEPAVCRRSAATRGVRLPARGPGKRARPVRHVDERSRRVHGVELRRRAFRETSSPRASIDASIASTSTRRGGNVIAGALAEVDGYPLDVTTQSDTARFPGRSGSRTGSQATSSSSSRAIAGRPHWESLADSGFPRQEVSWVRAGNRFYLAGGDRRHEAYDPTTDTWMEVSPLPERLDHIQGVEVGGLVYYMGGLSAYPSRLSEPYGSTIPRRTASAGGLRCRDRVERAGSPSTTARSTTREGCRKAGGRLVRRLRPGDRLVVAAPRHAAAARPLPGAGGRLALLRDRRA